MTMLYRALFLTAMLAASVWPHAARSQPHIGFRGGVTIDPDQANIGLMGYTSIAPNVRLQPNIDLGFGGRLTVLSFGAEVVYVIPTQDESFIPYFGGGPGIAVVRQGGTVSTTDTHVGFNFAAGAAISAPNFRPILIEAKVGLGDLPGLKVVVGIPF
jgi:hypothetical protein